MRFLTFIASILVSLPIYALDKSELVGYTLIDKKTIEDDFEGCDFDKKIVFIDGTYYECATYSYTYSFMPTAYIYAKKLTYKGKQYADIKMVVDDEVYEMYPIPLKRI